MTPYFRNCLIAMGTLVLAGMVRMPMERGLTADFREKGLLAKPVELATQKKLGQGFFAVTLGGLRSLVSTIHHLRAFAFFEEQKWDQVADTYDTIVQLSPHSPFYWDLGHWHMAYNAASHYQHDTDLPPMRANAEWRKWVKKGTAFLEEGIRQNPDKPYLWKQLGWLYANPLKLTDYDKAADAYHMAVMCSENQHSPYLRRAEAYAVARSSRIDEALPLVREVWEKELGNVPTLRGLRYALEVRANPAVDRDSLISELFRDRRHAYKILSDYYLAQDDFPMDGVTSQLRKLEEEFEVPPNMSVFKLYEEIHGR